MNRQSRRVLVVVAAAIVAVGGGLYWYLRDDAPAAVDLETAAASVGDDDSAENDSAENDSAENDSAENDAAADPVDPEGTWTVDAESGEFDFETATGTFAGFRVKERLSEIGEATAVGRTGDVTGTIEIEGTALTAAAFEVDLTTITTNDRGRDGKVQSALETSQFPTASFVLAEPVELGEAAATGAAISVVAVGDLTIHGVTQRVQFPIDAQVVGDTIVVVGSLDLTFADYGVTAPTAPIVLSVDESGVLELQVLLAKS